MTSTDYLLFAASTSYLTAIVAVLLAFIIGGAFAAVFTQRRLIRSLSSTLESQSQLISDTSDAVSTCSRNAMSLLGTTKELRRSLDNLNQPWITLDADKLPDTIDPGTVITNDIPTPLTTLNEKLTPPLTSDRDKERASSDNATWETLGQTTDGAQIFIKPTSPEDVVITETSVPPMIHDPYAAEKFSVEGVVPPAPTPPPDDAAEIDIDTHTLRPAGTTPPTARRGL